MKRHAALQAAVGSVLVAVLAVAEPAGASSGHRHAHRHYERRHEHGIELKVTEDVLEEHGVEERGLLVNRAGECAFPSGGDGLVAVTTDQMNRGWAMSPDQECTRGSYCPIACKPGMVMAQWQPGSSYVYPASMNGGLYCDDNGSITKPFPGEPYCVESTGPVNVVNNCGKNIAFCQTVLPGNEAMLIPTNVVSTAALAVPGPSYWASTAAHFYINPPGTSTADGCAWGDSSKPIGNWTPFVAGANTVANGDTYVTIGYNPKYLDDFPNILPSFGVKIECPSGGCNGVPCSINPSTDGYNVANSATADKGAGGAAFCVVTVPSGSSANIVLFNTDGSTGKSSTSSVEATTSIAKVKGLVAAATKSETTPTSTPALTTFSTTSSEFSTISTTSSTTSTTSSSSSSSTSSSSSSSISSTISTISSSSSSLSSSSISGLPGGIFQENGTTTATTYTSGGIKATITSSAALADAATETAAAASTSSESGGTNPHKGEGAIISLIVAFVAAISLL